MYYRYSRYFYLKVSILVPVYRYLRLYLFPTQHNLFDSSTDMYCNSTYEYVKYCTYKLIC